MKPQNKKLIIAGTCKDCMSIIDRLVSENPDMTIQEYLDKWHKELLILR